MENQPPLKSLADLPSPQLPGVQVGAIVMMRYPANMAIGRVLLLPQGKSKNFTIRLSQFFTGATGKKFNTIMRRRDEFDVI